MIRLVLLDIDGVLTDGRVAVDAHGNETKTFNFKDVDAVFELRRRGVLTGLVTGEDTPVTEVFRQRFRPDHFLAGCRDKAAALDGILRDAGCDAAAVCFVGDARRDIGIMKRVGLPACPADAIDEVQAVAAVRLLRNGGAGCVWELLGELERRGLVPPPATAP